VHDSIHLGSMTIVIDQAGEGDGLEDVERTVVRLPLSTAPRPVPADWMDPAPANAMHRDASLIEAFCEGAKLDASALLAHDPADLMRRAGAIYQQTVLGLATLMSERSRLKAELDLDRTTIRAEGNNPFKWAASRRLAQDLLCATPEGFLSDAEAVRACFEDLSAHVAAVAIGANSVANMLLDTFSPSAIGAEADERGFSLRGRAAMCWEIHARRHAALTSDGDGDPVRQAFVRAYAGDAAVRIDG
jgi:type VI secretion system FHA domain protein